MNEPFLPINLPSNCLTYDGISPENITIKAYTGEEAVYLADITPNNLAKKYLQVLNKIVKGIDPSKLTLGDRLYIIIWQYAKSYSNIVHLPSTCSHCLHKIEDVSIDLGKLNIINLPDNFKQPIEIPITDEKIKVRLLTVEDDIKIEKYDESHDDTLLFRLALSIVDDSLDILEKMTKLRKMVTKDISAIEAFHQKYYHGPELNTKYTCPNCGEEDEIIVPFWLDLFYPQGSVLTRTFGGRV